MFDSYEDIFARRADGYDRAMAAVPEARDAEFRAVLAPFGSEIRTIFDMPAGSGYLRRYLPADVHYVAIEPAEYFFERCPVDEGARRIRSAIEAVPLPDASTDAIVSLAGVHHAPDLGEVFGEFRRLLRPGGTLVLADVAEDSGPARFLNGYVHDNSGMGHDGHFLDGATAPLLCESGFGIVTDAIVDVRWRFSSAEEAGRYCTDLFGIEGPDHLDVARNLGATVGTTADASGFSLHWTLRRILCRAICPDFQKGGIVSLLRAARRRRSGDRWRMRSAARCPAAASADRAGLPASWCAGYWVACWNSAAMRRAMGTVGG